MVLRLPQSLKIQRAVLFDWIATVGICVVVVYISYLPPRELYFAPDRKQYRPGEYIVKRFNKYRVFDRDRSVYRNMHIEKSLSEYLSLSTYPSKVLYGALHFYLVYASTKTRNPWILKRSKIILSGPH